MDSLAVIAVVDSPKVDEEDAVINDDTPTANEDIQTVETEEEADDGRLTSSPYVTTNILFTEPEKAEFPAGKMAKLVVGFHNNGSENFIVDSIEASLRYPQDFSYFLQNFSSFNYYKTVEATKESTFEYAFTPSETFANRPFGLVISLNYKDIAGKLFSNTLFNDTVTVVESDEGLDGETFFLYIFFAAIIVLLLVLAQHFFSVFSKKHRITKKQNGHSVSAKSNGTNGSNDVDFEWIPKEHLQQNKSPRQSPRQRKTVKSGAGSGSETEAK